jgi:hypothetical protein
VFLEFSKDPREARLKPRSEKKPDITVGPTIIRIAPPLEGSRS